MMLRRKRFWRAIAARYCAAHTTPASARMASNPTRKYHHVSPPRSNTGSVAAMPGGGGKEGAAALLDGDTVTLPLLDTVSPLLAPEPLTETEDDVLTLLDAMSVTEGVLVGVAVEVR